MDENVSEILSLCYYFVLQIWMYNKHAWTGADLGFAKGGGPWRARGVRAYNGGQGLSPEPPTGSSCRAPDGAQGGKAPSS